jgi:hypothetical protein
VNESAISSNTQKIQKARKMGIPVVKAREYLEVCKANGKKMDLDDFLVQEPVAVEEVTRKKQKRA